MSLEKDITGIKHIFEDDFKGADDAEVESRRTEEEKKDADARKVKEEEERVVRQEQLGIALEKYEKFLKVIDILGFIPVNPEPPIDNGWSIDIPTVHSRGQSGLTLSFYIDTYRYRGDINAYFPKVTIYGGYTSDSEDADTKNLSRFDGDELLDEIHISTTKTADRIAGDIARRLLPDMTASVERMKGRVSAEIIQLNKKRKIIQDTVSILGLRPQSFDKDEKIYTYLDGKVDRFELVPQYGGDAADIKLTVKSEALPALLKAIKKLG